LVQKLEQDIAQYIGERRDLADESKKLMDILIEDGLISADEATEFPPVRYNAIITRFRDFWLKYFLQEIYHYEYNLTSFEIWAYRAKQIGSSMRQNSIHISMGKSFTLLPLLSSQQSRRVFKNI
jgi:hypothetical protein